MTLAEQLAQIEQPAPQGASLSTDHALQRDVRLTIGYVDRL